VKSLGPSNDDNIGDDLHVAEIIATHEGLRAGDNIYVFVDSSGFFISTGDQDEAYAWDISSPLAEQLAETAADDAAAGRTVAALAAGIVDAGGTLPYGGSVCASASPEADAAPDHSGNEASTGTACTCGHSVEEHGNDPEFPGSTACDECDCIAYESDGAP
jgi:hypothetical protein